MVHSRRALAVGIDKYPESPLAFCVNDAEAVAAALAMPEFGFVVDQLLDQNATRRDVRTALETLLSQEADVALFYFSGHGCATDVATYLMTIDGDPVEPGIDLDYVRRAVSALCKPRSLVIVLDCCHSGAAAIRAPHRPTIGIRGEDITAAIPVLGAGRVVLAACGADQLTQEMAKLGHGVFTHHLLEGLLGPAADNEGTLTVNGLHEYVARSFETEGHAPPVFRGDIAGRVVLGVGLPPSTEHPDPVELLDRIEGEAERHIVDFQTRIGPVLSDYEVWKATGHRLACATLEPLLRWFDKKTDEYPALRKRARFKAAEEAAGNRLASICVLEQGVQLEEGTVSSRLGSGAFGTVWRVQPHKSELPSLAFKAYHPQDLSFAAKIDRFERGFRAMLQLDHPHIVKVKRLTRCPLGFYMDFIEGPNFRQFTGTFDTPADIVALLMAIGDTLQHAHGRGVIHRDVKPENILMSYDQPTGQWRPHLTDFDLAWFSTATQVTTDAIGTVYYAAPEQLAKPGSVSAHAPTTDVFSLGQVCFFAVMGTDPVPLKGADNARALRGKLAGGRVESAARGFLELYERATQDKPEQRFSDVRELCDGLSGVYRELRAAGEDERLSVERVVRETVFSIVGLLPYRQYGERMFLSPSGETRIELVGRRERTDDVDLEARVSTQSAPVVSGVGDFEKARVILNQRIDWALRDFPGCRRRSGRQGPFEAFLDIPSVQLRWTGVDLCRRILMRTIDAVENR